MLVLHPRSEAADGLQPADGPKPVTDVPLSVLSRPRLAFFLPWILRLALGFGLTELLAGVLLPEPAFVGAGALTAVFGVIVLLAQRMIVHGGAFAATWIVAIALTLAGFFGTLLVPNVDEAMALLPILGFALLLPYAVGQRRLPIILLVVFSTGLILVGAAIGNPAPFAGPEGEVFSDAILLAIVGLVIAALVDFWDNAVRSLTALDAAVSRQHSLSD